MKRLMLIVACLTLITMVIGCNTVKGLGKDVEKTGEAIQGK